MKVVVVLRGGMVQSVYADKGVEVEVDILDMDDLADSGKGRDFQDTEFEARVSGLDPVW